ncbi:hypothetical protein J8273_1344 [Carpediemonas membranifera]|uniref:EF-hand domain-containing protein n=1 Tax=Carpediemonas membranifera TaxID=201153 RepID=A0A8J6B111_9EUKA|nr:hypothetical protein J8273_1344 [Carpediemonas membranifera]|eukprot:KAG9396995.1 hypothetical protein J8273_1344 [Carpediemonas membranifera]
MFNAASSANSTSSNLHSHLMCQERAISILLELRATRNEPRLANRTFTTAEIQKILSILQQFIDKEYNIYDFEDLYIWWEQHCIENGLPPADAVDNDAITEISTHTADELYEFIDVLSYTHGIDLCSAFPDIVDQEVWLQSANNLIRLLDFDQAGNLSHDKLLFLVLALLSPPELQAATPAILVKATCDLCSQMPSKDGRVALSAFKEFLAGPRCDVPFDAIDAAVERLKKILEILKVDPTVGETMKTIENVTTIPALWPSAVTESVESYQEDLNVAPALIHFLLIHSIGIRMSSRFKLDGFHKELAGEIVEAYHLMYHLEVSDDPDRLKLESPFIVTQQSLVRYQDMINRIIGLLAAGTDGMGASPSVIRPGRPVGSVTINGAIFHGSTDSERAVLAAHWEELDLEDFLVTHGLELDVTYPTPDVRSRSHENDSSNGSGQVNATLVSRLQQAYRTDPVPSIDSSSSPGRVKEDELKGLLTAMAAAGPTTANPQLRPPSRQRSRAASVASIISERRELPAIKPVATRPKAMVLDDDDDDIDYFELNEISSPVPLERDFVPMSAVMPMGPVPFDVRSVASSVISAKPSPQEVGRPQKLVLDGKPPLRQGRPTPTPVSRRTSQADIGGGRAPNRPMSASSVRDKKPAGKAPPWARPTESSSRRRAVTSKERREKAQEKAGDHVASDYSTILSKTRLKPNPF